MNIELLAFFLRMKQAECYGSIWIRTNSSLPNKDSGIQADAMWSGLASLAQMSTRRARWQSRLEQVGWPVQHTRTDPHTHTCIDPHTHTHAHGPNGKICLHLCKATYHSHGDANMPSNKRRKNSYDI